MSYSWTGHSSDECKVLSKFGSKYKKIRSTEERRQYPQFNKRKQQEKNDITQHAVYETILQDKEKLSVKDETHNNIDDEVDEDELYELEKLVLMKKMT